MKSLTFLFDLQMRRAQLKPHIGFSMAIDRILLVKEIRRRKVRAKKILLCVYDSMGNGFAGIETHVMHFKVPTCISQPYVPPCCCLSL